MRPPRWFYAGLLACCLALTVSAVLHFRYERTPGSTVVFDTWRRAWCLPQGCVTVGSRVVDAPVPDRLEQRLEERLRQRQP